MRPGNNNRRGRNRGQRKQHGGIPSKNQSYDGGGETRVRGNVYQILEKYLQLARDAGVAGDRIAAENYLQHADHYYRVIQAMNDGQRPRVGGRDISVADFNVQNVSQGLSAALYTGGQAPQANMSEGSGAGGGSAGAGQGSGSNANAAPAEGGDSGAEGDDEAGFSRPQGRGPRNRQQNRHDGRNSQFNGQYANGQSAGDQAVSSRGDDGGQTPDAQPDGNAARPASAPPGDDQPDYPEVLLPATAEARSSEDGSREEGGGRSPRARGRLRSRRPRHGAGTEASAEPALPGVEGGD
ncbi:uncharacterized protein DUF4167 [Dongia mobilis]|uniref:Uncharacterized protein DUF4167 n=1 Tax=Dongia mobilis TaxID=578943 RepID=A0A4R6WFJ0_9PROT|nr:DUF4167 domain-containing protein [Dongia mobilis]TDQ78760.1 uncharacterized protein DUF4167 [Dongia mobilis]